MAEAERTRIMKQAEGVAKGEGVEGIEAEGCAIPLPPHQRRGGGSRQQPVAHIVTRVCVAVDTLPTSL